jgi:hypothetical protein
MSDVLTDAQLAGYAKNAGFTGNGLVMAVAVALAETRGHPTATAHNPVPPDDSYGPWQINMYGALGPERRKAFGLSKNEDLYNVATNAKAAYAISSGGKRFGAWSTYTAGIYLGYLPRARKAANAPDTSGGNSSGDASGGGVVQASNPFSFPGQVIDFFTFITDPITWMRAGMLIAGGLLLLFALNGVSGGAVTDLIPQARVLKMAGMVK